MKIKFSVTTAFLGLLLATAATFAADTNQPAIIPRPQSMELLMANSIGSSVGASHGDRDV